jgi:hypothetical protein
MSLNLINDSDEKHDRFGADWNNWSHYKMLDELIRFMRKRKFSIKHDASVHKCIRKDHWVGVKGELRFVLHRYPRGFSFKFYQEVVTVNRHGGRYDFDKFKKAPYLIRLSWINETNKMSAFLESLGIENCTGKTYSLAEDKIKAHFVDSWHHPQKDMNFALKDLNGTTCEGTYNNTDRDKKTIYNGEVKYFRDYRGRLCRGIVYHNINNMWWVILNKFNYTNEADFSLFDPADDDFKIRRKVRDKKPKEYIEKVESLSKLSNKELLRELKKRNKLAI